MEESILKEILSEMKGFREDNKILKSEIEQLRNDTNQRFDVLNEHQKGLKTSVEVLQYAINETRYELIKIKEYLVNRVIWNNDSINIVAENGKYHLWND